jgi:hypothetical protein
MRERYEQELERWRILLFARDGMEMLVFQTAAGVRLPELQIPRWQRTAYNLNAEARRVWSLDTFAMCPLQLARVSDRSHDRLYHVMEVCDPDDLARMAPRSALVSSLEAKSFADPQDFDAVQMGMKLQDATNKPSGPFAQFGSFERICKWVSMNLESNGLHWNGSFSQLQASASFSLIRFETERHAVWFKAVGHPNAQEFLITTTLAARLPKYLPKLLATNESCNGFLMSEAEGTLLLHSAEISDWERAVMSLADMQIESIPRSDEILSAGALDLRTRRLQESMNPFFSVVQDLMHQQKKAAPPPLSDIALGNLKQDLENILLGFARLEIPDALLHLDCNPGNIVVGPRGCTFIDWAEAAVGIPFLTFQHVLEFFRQVHPNQPGREASMRNTYADRWRGLIEYRQIQDAMNFIPAVAAFAEATAIVARHGHRPGEEQTTAASLRSLTRRIDREVERIQVRRKPS